MERWKGGEARNVRIDSETVRSLELGGVFMNISLFETYLARKRRCFIFYFFPSWSLCFVHV